MKWGENCCSNSGYVGCDFIWFILSNASLCYGNDRFMETKGKQLEFKESVYNMEDGSEIAYL